MKDYHFEETFPETNGALDVMVEIGSAEIVAYDGTAVIVDAEARHMDISVTREANTIFIRAQTDETWADLGKKITRYLKNDHPIAHLKIQLPAHCELQAKTVTGKLAVNGLSAPVTARVVTGQTKLTNLSGPIYAKTITGELTYEGTLAEEHHRFETTTGRVHLKLWKQPNAQLDAKSITGNIHCEFPITQLKENRHLTGGRLTGVLGNGGGHIKARVVTGNLHLENG
ncbi:MAG: DUF4097 domain-containing protein [Chloroflexi bacterium]|nr:DUF4097 domain-containing protein [Chloroflexota bacterium]